MWALARGIIRGLAKHFDEIVRIEEGACMLRGAAGCEISVKLAVQSLQRQRAS